MPIYTIGHQLTILETVDSSNNYAMGQLQEQKAVHGQVYFALEQTAGKGQMGKQWISEPASNIMASIVLETSGLAHSDQFFLSMAMALGCRHWFAEYAGEETLVKWPNDLYWRDRKAGGILIENKWLGAEWQFAVVGIGININQKVFPDTPRKAVSLRQITGREMDLLQELRRLCNSLELRWQQLLHGRYKEIFSDYQRYLFGRDQLCRLRKNNIVFETRIKGVSITGELQTQDQVDRQFKVGEIEWL
ncbi:biotin--[acetyl-CoA-carboxylase] ligase [Flavihumibacter sp. CACIAM 22H1]|uniref:biotin--[acetyl-CoA-carboxylase] ligase n=1 Tax=Flavihumibacter sp. CACIAM 22H1 TaxID=1812911 RepID=UPI000A418775|nr:biotin--[acetyl-CoA-carboxylase] ligase [Flavihumibacter sp. CACIAM 22H1]